MLNEVKSWTSSSNFFSLTNLDTASQLQPRKKRVLLFVGANEKSDWNFSLKIKPKEMGEAPEGGWIQSQYQTATQPAAVPKSCFQVSRSWRLWGHLWTWLQQLSCRHKKDYLHSSRRGVQQREQEEERVITSDVTAAGWFVWPDTRGWASRPEIPPKINSWAWGHRSGRP